MVDSISDYIDSLEGKDDLNPLEVAQKLSELHNQEISTREAKIEELTSTIAERDGALTAKDGEIQTWKAKNFDLAMMIPGAPVETPPGNDSNVDGGTITISDLFEKGKSSAY